MFAAVSFVIVVLLILYIWKFRNKESAKLSTAYIFLHSHTFALGIALMILGLIIAFVGDIVLRAELAALEMHFAVAYALIILALILHLRILYKAPF